MGYCDIFKGLLRRSKRMFSCGAGAALLAGALILCMFGCSHTFTMTAEHGEEIPADVVSEIVIGKTTRSDIFRLFGPPDSIFYGQAEFTDSVTVGLYSHRENRYLDTFGDERYGMLYRFKKASDKSTHVALPLISWKNERIRTNSDELFFILDSRTNIVEDVAYRKASD